MAEKIFRAPTFQEVSETIDHIELVNSIQAKKDAMGMGLDELQRYDHWLFINTYWQSHAIKPICYKHMRA